ncbi:glycosyltransferase family 2 protein [Nocardia flavorosea]|uniref:Glycosyltransferase family 2 protein n=1 Tax=Nocardia flavorosea TaxID=53429 RepID=A0A846YBK3_9NOCA|nr:glycosyltransferase family 2 protein [Nocardia flavorosea]NKY57006.1 glycosyltransferase family 2 protein [Nocardia flavorosea]
MPTGGHWYSGHNRGRRTATSNSPDHEAGPRISVVVPVLNEAKNLRQVLPTVPESYEVIVVDGGSTDDSMDAVAQLRPSAIRLRQTRWGKGNALGCGFAAATGDIVVMFDADGSADAREIDAFVATLLAGADFAKGTRFAPGGGSADITTLRSTGNNGLTRLANRLFGMHFTDLCYGYNAFWRDVLPLLGLPDHRPADGVVRWGDGFEIETVITCRAAAAGLVIREVPSHEKHRLHGPSNLHAWRDGRRVLRTLLHEWRSRDRSVRLSAAATHFAPRRTELGCPAGERHTAAAIRVTGESGTRGAVE